MDESTVRRRGGVDYGIGQVLDIYEPEHPRGSVALLLWHGSGPNERDVLEPLARQIAAGGVTTLVPDWNSDDGGRGRHHLTASLAFAGDHCRRTGTDRIVLAGWSLGANAGLDVVLLTTVLGGWCPAGFVGLSGGFDDSPYRAPDPVGVHVEPSLPLLLVHGSSDEVVGVDRSRVMCGSLRRAGWDVTLREVETDHAGAIGAVYRPADHRCVASEDPERLRVLATVAGWVVEFALAT